MLLNVDFQDWSYDYSKLTEEEWAELREAVPTIPAEKPSYGIHGTHCLDDDSIRVVAKFGIPFIMSKSDRSGTMLVKLQDRIDTLEMRQASINRDLATLATNGCAVQITIPDFALMNVNQVMHLDNCCTDELQSYLELGWRLLAVCPPNAQRRPDYILGRRQ